MGLKESLVNVLCSSSSITYKLNIVLHVFVYIIPPKMSNCVFIHFVYTFMPCEIRIIKETENCRSRNTQLFVCVPV